MLMNANAVWISKAEKSYVKLNGKPLKVFQDVNMVVPRGSIYGLLGPSGCGKTSILRCIIGRQKFDSGKLLVLGYPPGSKESKIPGSNVGYMPQDICLVDTMSIKENIWYYGAIFGLSDDEIDRRMTYYTNLLRLPPKKSIISKLSSGQARRVSLTIALLHRPKLVILDEPTVGIDPIVKANIWSHLLHLVNVGKTSIIVTTHYIEEACNAHRVGIMQAGSIVAEDCTDTLLSRYNCNKLEDVLLKLAYGSSLSGKFNASFDGSSNLNAVASNEKSSGIPKIVITESSSSPTLSTSFPVEECDLSESRTDIVSGRTFWPMRSFTREFRIRKRPLQSIIMKNALFLMRFPGAVLSLLLLPVATIALFYYAYEGPIQPLVLKVVNEDLGDMGRQFIELIDPHVLKLISCGSMTEANKRTDDAYGIIHLNKNFSENLQENHFKTVFQRKHSKDVQLHIHNSCKYLNDEACGFSNYHIKMRMIYHVFSVYQQLVTTVTNSSMYSLPIHFNSEFFAILENPSFRVATFNTAILFTHFCAFGGTILLLFIELKKGYIERNLVAGITSLELFFGLMTVQSLIIFVQCLSNTILFVICYQELIKGSWTLIFLLFVTAAMTGSFFGLTVSVAIDQFYQIVLFGIFCCITAGCTTAAFYPVEAMPYFFQYFCKATPLYFPVQALKSIVHYGWGLTHLTVLAGFLTSFIWMGIFLFLFVILFNRVDHTRTQ